MSWFDVDRKGLAALLEHRGKAFAIFELVQNAWDSGASKVEIIINPVEGSPYAILHVTDDSPDGWANLDDSFTVFGRSRRAADPEKRGRFCLGEKMVLSLCRRAVIITTTGTVQFDPDGNRRRNGGKTERGTAFTAEIRMTRAELDEASEQISRLIPPLGVRTTFNGIELQSGKPIKSFSAKLPTMIADEEGNLRPSTRQAVVNAYPSDDGGEILELGIPVCRADWPWRLDVLQKVPLNMDRNSVTDGFRRALQVAATNALAETITEEQSTAPWASEAMGDSRIKPEALKEVVAKRFGDRAVVAVPGDPIANATAEAMGCTVIHGGALSSDAWANVRKHQMIPSSSAAFPTPKPADTGGQAPQVCPLCKQPVSK